MLFDTCEKESNPRWSGRPQTGFMYRSRAIFTLSLHHSTWVINNLGMLSFGVENFRASNFHHCRPPTKCFSDKISQSMTHEVFSLHYQKKNKHLKMLLPPSYTVDAFTNLTCENFNKMRFKAIAKVPVTSLGGKKSAELYGWGMNLPQKPWSWMLPCKVLSKWNMLNREKVICYQLEFGK